MKSNPFFELYIGDKLPAREFVTIFSDFLVPHAEAIFSPGNVVVSGVQGSGKSMLLSLLKPSIRLEYAAAEEEFPVPKSQRKFISASVNLAHQNAIDFGLRKDIDDDPQLIEFLFADFLNYLILQNLFKSISFFLSSDSQVNMDIRSEIGLNVNEDSINEIIPVLSNLAIWEGWFIGCTDIGSFQSRIEDRIRKYKRYNHRIDRELSEDILKSRTPIGEPIRECVSALKTSGAIDVDTNIFVEIDQYEELGNIASRDTPGKVVDYRSVVNRALATRDTAVSYRIGTRGHAWRRHGKIMGATAQLEEERDYKYVDLDVLLRRNENPKTNIFPKFACDVFARRLRFAEFREALIHDSEVLESVYGARLSAADKVRSYNITSPEKVLRFERDWKPETKNRLRQLSKQDLLSAKLGEVWIRQKGDTFDLDVSTKNLPWEAQVWWKKERREIVTLQIASQSQQKPIWSGADEIVGLSGGNILVFLSLNQFIWDTWIQHSGVESLSRDQLPAIKRNVQSIGISKASKFWSEKVATETGRSAERLRFTQVVSEFLAKRLHSDRKLSNPGETGFSMLVEEMEEYPDAQAFLEELADYGNLLMLDHTTKNNNRRLRKKFYLNPIFCPGFNIPYVRTKEPYYAKVREVLDWMHRSRVLVGLGPTVTEKPRELFSND